MHRKHEGHESMHAEMLIVMLVTLLVAQFVLVEWKKRHLSSYQVILKKVSHIWKFNAEVVMV